MLASNPSQQCEPDHAGVGQASRPGSGGRCSINGQLRADGFGYPNLIFIPLLSGRRLDMLSRKFNELCEHILGN